jgi:hypothetical protein
LTFGYKARRIKERISSYHMVAYFAEMFVADTLAKDHIDALIAMDNIPKGNSVDSEG